MNETKLRTGLILLIGALGVLQPLSLDPYLPNISIIAKDLSSPAELIQQNLTFLTLGISLGTLIAGPLSDAIGRRRPVLFALAGYVFAALLVANAASVELFFAGRVLQGIFAACAWVVSTAMLRDMYEGLKLIRAMGLSMALMASTWFLGPAYGSILQSFTDWRGLSTQLSIIAGLLLITIFFKLPDTMTVEQRTKTTAKEVATRFVHLLKDRVFLGLVGVQVTISVSLFSYLSVSPFVYSDPYGVPTNAVGFYLAINSVGAYVGSQLGTWLSQRFKPQYVLFGGLVVGMLAGATLIATAVFQLPFIVFTSGLALFTLGFGTTFTPLLGLAMTAHPEEAGTASSVIAVSGTIATTLSGSFYAVLDHQSAIGIGITQFSLMMLGIILLFAVVRPNQLEVMK